MKRFLLPIFLLCTFLHSAEKNIDRSVTLLYTCRLSGKFDFDEDGRKGLATISEIKRRELESVYREKGIVLLLSRGLTFSEGEESSFKLLKTALFDTVLLSPEEMDILEKNPNLLKLDLPIIANRENSLGIGTEKYFEMEGIGIKVSNFLLKKLPHNPTQPVLLNLVFWEPGSKPDLENIPRKLPVIYFTPSGMSSAFSFSKNVTTAECPESGDVLGKIKLTYRKGELIRQHQEFISLNTKNSPNSWIEPFKPTLDEIQK